MSACVLVSWAPEATEKSTRIPTPTNRLNSARGSHHTLPDRPRSTASRISRSLCKLRRIRPDEAGQPISGRALSGGAQNASGAAAAPATADDVAKAASAAGALATATAAKLQTLGASPMDILRQAVAEGKGGDGAKTALATAEASFATLSDRAKACADGGAKAAQLAQGASGANQAALDLANGKLQDLLSGAAQANHEFEQAFAAFTDARQKI